MGAVLTAIASTAAIACAQDRYLLQSADLIHETFFVAAPEWRGFAHRGSWTEIKARANERWSATITNLQLRDRNLLDETFLEYDATGSTWRAGRMRSVFGQGRWTDLFYNVVSRHPIIRTMPLLDRYSLLGFNSGLEWHGFRNGWDFGIQIADGDLSDRQFLPESMNVIQGRVLAPIGDGQIGLSLSKVDGGFTGPGGEVVGLDYRRIANRVQVRAELVASRGSGLTSKGYFADVSYRLPGNHRTQIGVRLEEYAMGSTSAKMMTIGTRFVPLPQLAINLNYGFSPKFGALSANSSLAAAPFQRGYADSLKGWSLQTMFAFRFSS